VVRAVDQEGLAKDDLLDIGDLSIISIDSTGMLPCLECVPLQVKCFCRTVCFETR
jgi:hypothetical protein